MQIEVYINMENVQKSSYRQPQLYNDSICQIILHKHPQIVQFQNYKSRRRGSKFDIEITCYETNVIRNCCSGERCGPCASFSFWNHFLARYILISKPLNVTICNNIIKSKLYKPSHGTCLNKGAGNKHLYKYTMHQLDKGLK